jgi:hypothetical protein
MPASKSIKPKTQVAKKKLVAVKKAPVKSAKLVKPRTPVKSAKPVKAKVSKAKLVKTQLAKVVKPRRQCNMKPTLSDEAGINMSPSKIKFCVANTKLNCAAYYAIKELKAARPHTEIKTVDDVEVSTDVPGIPMSELSEATTNYIALAQGKYNTSRMNEYAKAKVAAFSDDAKNKYNASKKVIKDAYDTSVRDKIFEEHEAFDYTAFNKKYDSKFYDDYDVAATAAQAADDRTPWKVGIDICTKQKSRTGGDSRTIMTTFAEYVSMQIIQFGVRNCVATGKKIMKQNNLFVSDTSVFTDEFTLLPLISNLQSYKAIGAYLQKVDDVKATNKKRDADDESDPQEVPAFTLDGLSCWNLAGDLSDTQMDYNQFCYYISESTRTIRKQLALTEVDADGAPMDEYNYVSVSKDFKTCVSAIVTEILCRVADMIAVSIKAQGIKTVNDTVVKVVLSHYFTCVGVDPESAFEFIRTASQKHRQYVLKRQENRGTAKSDETGDMTYDE